jgi:hypothetical protein
MPDPDECDLARSKGAEIRRRSHTSGVPWLIFLRVSAGLVTGGVLAFDSFSTSLERSARTQWLTT